MTLLEDFKTQLSSELIRKASIICSKWSENYVVLGKPKPGPMTFKWHPWQKEMLDTMNWDGCKAAQMGYSHVALCKSIHANDIKKVDVLYLLPKRSPDATDFSKSKFDALLEMSPHLSGIYSNTRNIGHKQAGSVNLFIRGARSRSGLKTISVGLQIWDELDEMPQKMLALATERSSGYEESETIKISTPTIPDFGIDAAIKLTDQSIWVFKCPRCGKWTNLDFPSSLVVTADSLQDQEGLRKSYIKLPCCKGTLDHREKTEAFDLQNGAHWQPTNNNYERRGFKIHQLYSTVLPPWRIAETYLKGQFEPAEIREYWNSKGGMPYVEEGARVNDLDLSKCLGSYRLTDKIPPIQLLTMGVDPGKVIHYWIDQWLLPEQIGRDLNMFARCRCVRHGYVSSFEELAKIQIENQVVHAVIDWQPDERKSFEYCQRFIGHAHRCYFPRGSKGKMMVRDDSNLIIGVSRTAWLDLSQTRFKNQTIEIPFDTNQTVKDHIKNLVRLEKKDQDGNPVAKYVSLGSDHYAFARLYSETALPLALSAARNEDVSAFL